MVFASDVFIILLATLLPIYGLIVRRFRESAKPVLVTVSLAFYAAWIPTHLLLLVISIWGNFAIARQLHERTVAAHRRLILFIGLAGNLGAIAYFKYANFFVENFCSLVGLEHHRFLEIALPLGISFFTFQQISFLMDTYHRKLERVGPIDYILFVSFFPQLIAGPIVTAQEMIPQLRRKLSWIIRPEHLALGFFLFTVGLFKKVVLIDPYVPYIDVIFAHAAAGNAVSMLDGWAAALGYSFQIYLDFSGYSDMAIGLALMFGLKLPINFYSPYKAQSIRDFWRRWHITLGRFLQRYLYIPLGGNRRGHFRTFVALMGTMLLGGLWHGAGWQFVLWGALHGAMLAINHSWGLLRDRSGSLNRLSRIRAYGPFMALVTFLSVSVAWVFFRADSVQTAWLILQGMLGLTSAESLSSVGRGIIPALPIYFILVWALPNVIQLMRRFPVVIEHRQLLGRTTERVHPLRALSFRLSWPWALITACLFLSSWFSLSQISPFIYFQF